MHHLYVVRHVLLVPHSMFQNRYSKRNFTILDCPKSIFVAVLSGSDFFAGYRNCISYDRFRPSVCLCVTVSYHVKTTQATIMRSSLFFKTLPATLIVDERKLLFWKKMFLSTNVILGTVSYIVRNRFLSVGSQYGITACTISKCGIKDAVWQSFSSAIF